MAEAAANMTILWGTPIVEVRNPNHAQTKQALVDHCYEIERKSSAAIESGVTPLKKGNLYESKFDFFKSDVPEVQQLRQFCGEALSRTVFHLLQRSSPNEKPPSQIAVDMFESWIHITHDGGYHEVHYHPNCSWCGIYYLEAGDCTLNPPNGVNRFFSPATLLYEDSGSQAYRQTPATVAPEEGKLVLFPSYVQHSAVLYRGSRDRIVVSFNSRMMARP
jgi:uncharacterized protein (TIGR02466 family)